MDHVIGFEAPRSINSSKSHKNPYRAMEVLETLKELGAFYRI